jgi:hypothetical protein
MNAIGSRPDGWKPKLPLGSAKAAKRQKARGREEAGQPPADWTSEEKEQFQQYKGICASEPSCLAALIPP